MSIHKGIPEETVIDLSALPWNHDAIVSSGVAATFQVDGTWESPDAYGDAEIRKHEDGRLEVVRADDVIGISLELLAAAVGWSLAVDDQGLLWLCGDPAYRYRPVRFVAHVGGLPPGTAVEGCRVLVCERVR